MDLDDLPEPAFEGTLPVEELDVDGENLNEQTDEMFGLLCSNMRHKGWIGNAIVTDTDGLIADGEHRWRAAKEIGLDEVPVKQYEIDDADRRLWRQELNKISGDHDPKRDALEYDLLLSEGKSDDVRELANAADEDLDDLLAQIKVDRQKHVPYEYEVEHNVYFEDCIEGMRDRLEDDSVDMVFTSPPYNIDKDKHNTRIENVVAYEDNRTEDEYLDFLSSVFIELSRVLKPSGHLFINLGLHFEEGEVHPPNWVPDLVPLPYRSAIVWHKSTGTGSKLHLNENGQFYETWEPVFHFSENPRPLNGTKNGSVWEIQSLGYDLPQNQETGVHPAPFPIELPAHAIKATTSPGDVVLDPFMGSGTTAVAAIQSDRDYIGFELDEEGAYQPIVERRIQEAKRQTESETNAQTTDAAGDD